MDPNGTPEIIYNSLYRHGVDEKRRVQIPSKWRPAQPGVEFTIVVWPKHKTAGSCLRVLPPKKMDQFIRDISAMANDNPNKPILKRIIGSQSAQVNLDQSGRICLPEDLAKAAELKDNVVLVGVLDVFEIWNPERYEKVKASDDVLAQEAFTMME